MSRTTCLLMLWGLALWVLIYCTGCESIRKPSPCKNDDYVEVMKEQALAFYAKGNLIEALKSINDAEACKPKDPEVYYIRGIIYFQMNKIHEAIESFQKALSIDKDHAETHMALGVVYLKLERWDEAILEFEAAVQDDYFTRPWEAHNNMGWAYLQKGELALAEINFKKAIKQNENYCPAYTGLGELYSKQGDRNKAIVQFQKAIKLCPKNYARPRFLLGLEYGRLGFLDKACQELKQAAGMKNSEEAEQAEEYMRLYNCPGVVIRSPGG